MMKNKYLLLLSIQLACFTLTAQTTTQQTLDAIHTNYVKWFTSSGESSAALTEALLQIPPETEMSDQGVVELHQRYPLSLELIRSYIDGLQPDGSWQDINYKDTKRSGWDAKKHADRILQLSKYYATLPANNPLESELLTTIRKAWGFWFREKPVCKNWWYNQIGLPKTFGPSFLILKDKMTAEELEGAIQVMDNAKIGMTGQNKVWLAGNVMIKGLLQDNYQLVKECRDVILGEITVGEEEGIKSDWSFHQHGAQQQFGNYGMTYLTEMCFYANILAGTSLALNKEQQRIITNLLLQGYRWIIWKGYMDVNALDRQLFQNVSIHKAFATAFAATGLLESSQPEIRKEIEALIEDNIFTPGQPTNFSGLKHFWDSDQTIHRRPEWMASVKMASLRVIGTELVNEDNLKGFYMADGATYIYRKGDEYLNVFPFWDWRKIPGITSYNTDAPVPTNYSRATNNTRFVGGLTDGTTGMTAMVLNRDGVNAHKSWVFTDDFVLCLGSNIKTDSCLLLATSIDQRLKKDKLLIFENGKWQTIEGTKTSNSNDLRYYHDGVGYLLLQPTNVTAISEKRKGQFHDFMGSYKPNILEGEVISLHINHPENQQDSYAYLIIPDITPEQFASFKTSDVQLTTNSAAVQAVTYTNCHYITAYNPVTLKVTPRLQVEIKTPGIYMIRENKGKFTVQGNDPTKSVKELMINLNGKDYKVR